MAPGPALANDDTAPLAENTPVTIDELANDVGIAAALVPGSVAIVTQPHEWHGHRSIQPPVPITYTPGLNYFGPDTIQYTVQDSNGSVSNVGTISITVTFVDYPPVAIDDSAQTNPGDAGDHQRPGQRHRPE